MCHTFAPVCLKGTEKFSDIVAKYKIGISCKSDVKCVHTLCLPTLSTCLGGKIFHFLEVLISSSEYGEVLDK